MSDSGRVIPFVKPKRKAKACPVCGAAVAGDFHPFCSRRCADVDLGRWLKGDYAIPTEEAPLQATSEDEE